MSEHTFKDMPVYERGGKSIESLHNSYNDVFSKDERVGRDTFTDIMLSIWRSIWSKWEKWIF